MKHKSYKTIITFLAICFLGVTFAQKYEKKFNENFKVDKDVEIAINASNSDITVTNWNKNEVAITAYIEVEGVSKEEAEKYFKNWKFEALGNKSKVKISAQGSTNFSSNNEVIFFDNTRFDFPRILEIDRNRISGLDSIHIEKIQFPNMDFDFNFDNENMFDEIEKNIGKNGKYSFHFNDDDYDVKIDSKEDWEKFKKSKEYQKLKEKLSKDKEKMRKEMEVSREKMRKQLKEAQVEISKINKEEIQQQLKKAREELAKLSIKFSSDEDNIIINGKKVKITKKIEIKAPKGATFDLNTRHCKVKLPNTVAFGNIKYGSFDANNLNNSKLTINYSPVTIKDLNACNLFLNNVTDAKIASVTNTNINTNSSKVDIQNVHNNVAIDTKFGELIIHKIHTDFEKFSLRLNYANAILHLNDFNQKLFYDSNSNASYFTYNSLKKMNLLKENSKEFNGSFIIETTDKKLLVNGKYSQITVNQ